MEFIEFKNNISKLTSVPVGGLEAQFILAPKFRLNYSKEKIASKNHKKAAVLALFFPNKNGDTCFLLTLRANYNGIHSAQISFPGGKYDNIDKSLINTALRETNEEVGVPINDISIFKQMTDVYIPPSDFLVTPFLGLLAYSPSFIKNHEVEKTITVSLKELMNDATVSTVTLSTSYSKNMVVPCFKFENQTVWGATAMMLSEIKELLKSL
jgi:8-oxo-dGTP pyrophosphatase MutT (NUDIX family)